MCKSRLAASQLLQQALTIFEKSDQIPVWMGQRLPVQPSSRIPPYIMQSETKAVEFLDPLAHCQTVMDLWCNNLSHVPGLHYNASHWDTGCNNPPYPENYFTAKLIENEYRCIHDFNQADHREPCVCTRDAELREVACSCDAKSCARPNDPPFEAGDCVRDLGNSTRLYNVEVDPGDMIHLL
jgi:hypothetical protein